MGLEHFETGSGEGRGPASEPITVSVLGKSGVILPKGGPDWQAAAKKLYGAEMEFRKRTPKEARLLSEDNTRELVHTAIHHPAMDDVPGIDELRKTFNASNPVHLGIKDNLGYIGNSTGLGVVVPKERHVLNGIEDLPKNLMRLAKINNTIYPGITPDHPAFNKINKFTATHETSHLLANQQFQETAHQWPMARLHVHLVTTLFGKEHGNALKDWYSRYDIEQ